jgi:hypothetical protein
MKKRTLTKRKPQKSRKPQKTTKKRYNNRKTLKTSIYGSGIGTDKMSDEYLENKRKKDRERHRLKHFINKVMVPFESQELDDDEINEMIKNDNEISFDHDDDIINELKKPEVSETRQKKRKNDRESKRLKSFIEKVVVPFDQQELDDERINEMIKNDTFEFD